MLKLPDDLALHFDNFLLSETIYTKDQYFYKKWLRFYWDFCHKYHHDAFRADSLPLFLRKLQEKRQSEPQQNQAKQAVSLFYEMHTASKQPLTRNKSVSSHSQQSVNRVKAPSNNSSLYNSSKVAVVRDPVQHPPSRQTGSSSVTANRPLAKKGTSWVFVFDRLVSEIKIRHYSPKTLKAYRGWIRQLQTFTQSKDYQTLSQQDVVDFL